MIGIILFLIYLFSIFSKKTYMQLGDYIVMILVGSHIKFNFIPLLLIYISIFHILLGLVYIAYFKKNKIPMIPSILISWIILYNF